MKILFVLVSLLLTISANSQKITARFQDETPVSAVMNLHTVQVGDKSFDYQWVGKTSWSLPKNLLNMKAGLKLQMLDANTKDKKEKDLAEGKEVYLPITPTLKYLYGKLYFFDYKLSADEDYVVLEASEVNQNTLELNASKEILKFEKRKLGRVESLVATDALNLDIQQSPNTNTVAIVSSYGSKKLLSYAVFGNNFSFLRNGEAGEVEDAREFDVKDVSVTDNGNVYIPILFKNKEGFFFKPTILISLPNKTVKQIPIEPQGIICRTMCLTNGFDNNIAITGTYKEEGTDYICGVYKTGLNLQTNKIDPFEKMPVPQVFAEQLSKSGFGISKKKDLGMSPIEVKTTLLSDGTLCMTGQFKRVEWGERTAFSVIGNILVVYIKNGKAVYSAVPRLRVSVSNLTGSDYYTFIDKDKVIVFYNDHKDNLKRKNEDVERSDKYNNHVLTAAVVERDGTVKRELVLDDTENSFLSVPSSVAPIDASSFIISFVKVGGPGGIKDDRKKAKVIVE